MGNLKFNGVSTMDLGLVIQTQPVYTIPDRDIESTHVPGRNGDIVIDSGSYSNVERSYSLVSAFRPGTDFISNSEKIVKWLNSASGKYARLEDSYDPLVFRMAMYKGSASLTNYYNKATSISAVFNCKPQRYLLKGEEEQVFKSSSLTIENPTDQNSLPIITIEGIKEGTVNDIVLLTISNENKEVVSSISLSSVPNGSVVINSELQSSYDLLEKDMSSYVGLNGKDFPKFYPGKNNVDISKYLQHSTLVQKYNDIISTYQNVCKAQYKPYDTIVEANSKKFYFKSYDTLKSDRKESYEAESYLLYLSEKAASYTFVSYNSLLSTYGSQADITDDGDYVPDEWLTKEITSNSKMNLSAKKDGFFYLEGSKKIIFHKAGTLICTKDKDSGRVLITYYPSEYVDNLPVMQINYKDLPSWISAEVQYDSTNVEGRYIKGINFVTLSDGYYWKEKDGWFDKEGWIKCSSSNKITLASLVWSGTYFRDSAAMSTSKTKTFTFRYIESVIQYEDVTEETTDSDGNKVNKITSKVHFTVEINDDSISELKYIANDDGYFMCENSGSDSNNGVWTKVTKGRPIPTTSGLSLSTSDLNNIYYLDSIPDYSKETNFPDWLDPKPNMTPSDSINPQTIDSFTVKKDGYYLCNTTGKTSGVKPEEWTNLKAGSSIPVNQASDKTYYIYYIDKIPTSYVYGNIKDIAFNYLSKPPSYINVVLVDGEVQTLKYTTNAKGYYKWDSNDAWVNMESGQDLVTSGIKDDTTIYYMDKLPEYNSSSYPLFTMEINENSGGNPTGVDIKAKVSGYYRYNSGTDWKYYSVGEIILTSKITDSNTMYNLKSDSSTTFDLTITIIPKWWRL